VLIDEKGYRVSNAYGLINVAAIFLIDKSGARQQEENGTDGSFPAG